MKVRLILFSLLSFMATCQITGQQLKPFVKGGLTIGLFEGTDASNESAGHTGLNLGAGIQIPLSKSHPTFLEPALVLISKGNVYDVSKAGGRVTFNLWYFETQLDFVYRWKIGTHWRIPIGTGLYGAYGISSKVSATNGITWFQGIHLGKSPSMFDDEIGANRWDAGWRVCTFGAEYRQFALRCDFEIGFFSQFRNKKLYTLEKKSQGANWAFSLNIGYSF